MNYGMKVLIKFADEYQYPDSVLRNVTEIHYRYNSVSNVDKIAFESDIHGTGITYAVSDIREFSTSLESSIANEF